jgi:Fe-S-cluster-containing dehydrogenase component
MGVLVDIPNCIGCRQCEAACREANGFEALTDEYVQDKSQFAEYRRPGPHYYTTINSSPNRPLFRLAEDLAADLDRAVRIHPRRLELDKLLRETQEAAARSRTPAEARSLRAEVDRLQAEKDAMEAAISDRLAEAFARQGTVLSPDAGVTSGKLGQRWQVDNAGESYLVKREAGALAVCEDGPIYVKTNCFHCNDPACVSACLVAAFAKEADGSVSYNPARCMGCRYCMVACPFQIPAYEYDNPITPQVRKCTLCQNEGNPKKGGIPGCVSICPKECLTFGKRSDLLVRARAKIEDDPGLYSDHIYGEHEVGGTSWLYLMPKELSVEELGFLDLGDSAPPMRTERIQHGIFKYFIPPLAWFGLLGAVMWVSRPTGSGGAGESAEGEH